VTAPSKLRTFNACPDIRASFTNVNHQMGLSSHSHFALIRIVWEKIGRIGFPIFKESQDKLALNIRKSLANPLEGATNDDVAMLIFETVEKIDFSEYIARYDAKFRLYKVDLMVFSHEDDLGHPDGVGVYSIVSD
jgi:hypothetical protein